MSSKQMTNDMFALSEKSAEKKTKTGRLPIAHYKQKPAGSDLWPVNRCIPRIWRKEHESMDPSCLVSTVQAGDGGLMVWGIFSLHTLGPLDSYFQQDNAPCHKAQIISDWFLEHDNEFTLLKWPPQSPDLNPIEHLWDVVEREIRSRKICSKLWCYHVIMDQHLGGMFPTPCWICHEELRQFWRQTRSNPVLAMCP